MTHLRLDPDPLHVPEQPVHRYDGDRPGLTIPVTLACALLVVIVILANVFGAARSRPDGSPRPTASGASSGVSALYPGVSVRPSAPGGDAPYPPAPATGAGSEGGTMPPTTPMPGAPTWSGTATWYCGRGAACTRGYGPSDLVAAIDRKDSPFRKGDRVRVTYHCGGDCTRSVTVRIVDVCACGGARLIDLTTGAFRRLAPLGLGVIPVELEAAGAAPTPPATETQP